MIQHIKTAQMGKADYGWLKTRYHFSFADYYNPKNIRFGTLRVLNDDLVGPHMGFDMHPHKDMEIVSYMIAGELSHQDSMGNSSTISRGHVQYMSAGTGVMHSEKNLGDETVRLLQIWILPDQIGHVPNYGEHRFNWEDRSQKWLHLVSKNPHKAPIQIHQNAEIFALELQANTSEKFVVDPSQKVYLVQIEGESIINETHLQEGDALQIDGENEAMLFEIKAQSYAHFLLIQLTN